MTVQETLSALRAHVARPAQIGGAAAVRGEDLGRHLGISVVICTRNRVRLLGDAVESVLAQEYPSDRFELIIIDNGSSDGTGALAEQYVARAPVPVSYHVQPRLGAAFARNAGIERARGEYVAFVDDDAVTMPGWLAAYDAAIRERGAIAAGGPVDAVLERGVDPPSWWSDPQIRAIFGFDHVQPPGAGRVVEIRWPLWLGCGNSLYARRLLVEHGGFATDSGPVAHRYRMAQDTELNVRLERAGVPIHYVRDARIRHRVGAERLSRSFVCRRAYAAGMTNAAAWAMLGSTPPGAASVSQLVRAALRVVVLSEPARTSSACRLAFWLGYARQSWRRSAAQTRRTGT